MPRRKISMSLTSEDEDFVRTSEAETYEGTSEGVEVYVLGSGTIDSFKGTLVPGNPQWVLVSGIVDMIREGDELLGMGGHVSVGDWRASFPWPTIEPYWDTEKLRLVATQEVFTVEDRVRTGLGPTFQRGDLILKLKANE